MFSSLCDDVRARWLRVRESGAESMLGTMIGVLFLSVLTASFAGVFMAYSVNAGKSEQNSERVSLLSEAANSAVEGLFVDSQNGSTVAANQGWSVLTPVPNTGTTLFVLDPETNPAFNEFTFAAQKRVSGETSPFVTTWGVLNATGPQQGRVEVVAAVPRAGFENKKCTWRTSDADLESFCHVVTVNRVSVVSPPESVKLVPETNWEEFVTVSPWSGTVDYAGDTPVTVSTTTTPSPSFDTSVFEVGANGKRNVMFYANMSELQNGNIVRLNFSGTGPTSGAFSKNVDYVVTMAAGDASATTIKRKLLPTDGPLEIPEDVTSVRVTFNGKYVPGGGANTPFKIDNFFVYQTNPEGGV